VTKLFEARWVPALSTFLVLLLAWKSVSTFFLPTFLPAPFELLSRIIELLGKSTPYLVIWTTLERVIIGVVLSMVIGASIGLIMGIRRTVEGFLDSWIMVLLTFPAISWAFLAVLWFGISDIAPIFTVVLIVFPYVTMNVWEGTKAMDKALIDMARVFRANRWLMLSKVFIPALMPYIFSSLRISFALSWKIALVSEAFGVGRGVGKELMYWFQGTRADMMLAWGVSFMFFMVFIDVVVLRWWEKRSFVWRPRAVA
jgi:NitT/TauT family transport system permease protein